MSGLLLTAAVTPTVRHRVSVTDPEQRAAEYHAALRRWGATASRLGLDLVVVETTGAERSAFWPAGVPGRFLSCPPDACPPDVGPATRGKGAVEAAALDHAFARAPELGEGTVYKCTGRLWVANAAALLAPLPAATARLRRTLDWSWVEGRLLGASVDVWRGVLAGMADEVDDPAGRYLEHVLADRLRPAWASGRVTVDRLPRRPVYVGRSGSTGHDYGSVRERVKRLGLPPVDWLLTGPLASKLV